MSIASQMNCYVSIKTQTQTKNAEGYNSVPTLTVVASNVPARFTIMKPQVAAIYYGKYAADVYARIYLNTDQSLVLIGSWITYNGTDYEVIALENAGGQLGRIWHVDCIRKTF